MSEGYWIEEGTPISIGHKDMEWEDTFATKRLGFLPGRLEDHFNGVMIFSRVHESIKWYLRVDEHNVKHRL